LDRTQKIAKNTFFLIGAQVFSIVGRLLFSIFLVRYLGAINLGYISVSLALVELFNIITDFGLGIIATRQVSQDKSQAARYISNTLTLKLLLSIAASILVLIGLKFMSYNGEVRTIVYILIPSIFLNSLFSSFVYIFRAFENMQHESFVSLASTFFYVLLGSLAMYLKLNVYYIAALTSICAFINLLSAVILYLKNYGGIGLSFEIDFLKSLFKTSLPIGIGIILAMALSRLDVILLSYFKGAEAVGLYSAPYRLVATFLFVPYYLATSMFPAISDWKNQNRIGDLKNVVEEILRISMVLIIPVAVFVCWFSDKIIFILYGSQFIASAFVFSLLVWYLVAAFPAHIFTHLLFSSHTKEYAIFYFIALIINITLNVLLIPVWGITAVAVNAIISILVIDVLSYWRIYSGFFKLNIVKPIILPSIAAAVMAIFVFYFKNLNSLFLSFSSVAVYFLILYLIKGVTKQDLTFIKNYINFR